MFCVRVIPGITGYHRVLVHRFTGSTVPGTQIYNQSLKNLFVSLSPRVLLLLRFVTPPQVVVVVVVVALAGNEMESSISALIKIIYV